MKLLVDSMEGVNGRVVIATHSTAIISSLCTLAPNVRIGLKQFENEKLTFRPSDKIIKSVLPMFGAHPLLNVFNQQPPLIVEGEDDERIWQAAVRRSHGRIAIYPCVAGDIQSMNSYEVTASEILANVYDNARAFSLRDRDDDPYDIDDLGPVIRARLQCRAAENLLVTDDVLNHLGTDWPKLQTGLEKLITENPGHLRHSDAVAFRSSGWDRRQFNLKNLRMVIVGISGSTKPWEVAVGQCIASLSESNFDGPDCLRNYLGPKIVYALGLAN